MAHSEENETSENKDSLVHSTLFGRIDRDHPEAGFAGARIQVEDIGNIPGVLEHWNYEIDLRKQEIQRASSRSLVKRAMGALYKKKLGKNASGEELLQFHSNQKIIALLNELKDDPQDSLVRLQVVSEYAKVKQELPLELYRILYLQAGVACSLGNWSTQELKITLRIQKQYFFKFFNKCKEVLNQHNHTLSSLTNDKSTRNERGTIEQKIREVQKNMKVLRLYQLYTGKVVKELTPGDITLSHLEIKNCYQHTSNSNEFEKNKQLLLTKFLTLIQMMRSVLLLHRAAHELLDVWIELDKENPIGPFLKGRVSMSALTFAVSRYEGGEHSQKTRQDIQDSFKAAYHHYGMAVDKIGANPQGTDFTVLIEYAQLVYYFYSKASKLMEMKLPPQWVQSALTKARDALILAEKTGKVDKLLNLIGKAMAQESR